MTREELRALRQALGLTQRALAARLGLHVNTIWQYEKGWRTISAAVAAQVQRLAATEPVADHHTERMRTGRRTTHA